MENINLSKSTFFVKKSLWGTFNCLIAFGDSQLRKHKQETNHLALTLQHIYIYLMLFVRICWPETTDAVSTSNLLFWQGMPNSFGLSYPIKVILSCLFFSFFTILPHFWVPFYGFRPKLKRNGRNLNSATSDNHTWTSSKTHFLLFTYFCRQFHQARRGELHQVGER